VTLCGRDPGDAWSRSSPRAKAEPRAAAASTTTTTTNARTTCRAERHCRRHGRSKSKQINLSTPTKHGALNWKLKSFESNKAPRISLLNRNQNHLRCHKIYAGDERSGGATKGPAIHSLTKIPKSSTDRTGCQALDSHSEITKLCTPRA